MKLLTHPRTAVWAWLALSAVLLLTTLNRASISGDHERRVYETALTMSQSGSSLTLASGETVNPWLIPVFEGKIRLQKPPVPYWMAAGAFAVLGESPGAARLGASLCGLLTLFMTHRLAMAIGGKVVATLAVAMLASLMTFNDEFRKAMADPYLAAFCITAVACFFEGSRAWLLAGYVALALAAMSKGPVALLHVGVPVVLGRIILDRRLNASLAWHAAGLVLFAAITLPWPLYVLRHVPNALELWRFESVGEFADNTRNASPIWFYLPQLLVLALPWTPVAIVRAFVRKNLGKAEWFGLAWVGVITVIFSLAHMKKAAYLLPILPAIAILLAHQVRVVAHAFRDAPRPNWATLGYTTAAVVFAAFIAVMTTRYHASAAQAVGVIAVACIAAAIVGVCMFVRSRLRAHMLVCVGFALLATLYIAFPQADRRASRRPASVTVAAPASP